MTPFVSGLSIARQVLLAALSPLVPDWKDAPACFWRQNPIGTVGDMEDGALASLLVVQSQDNGGQSELTFGSEGWSGLVTVRCISPDLDTAEALRDAVPAALASLSAPGYSIRADHVRPLDLSPLDGIQTVASVYRIIITPE